MLLAAKGAPPKGLGEGPQEGEGEVGYDEEEGGGGGEVAVEEGEDGGGVEKGVEAVEGGERVKLVRVELGSRGRHYCCWRD